MANQHQIQCVYATVFKVKKRETDGKIQDFFFHFEASFIEKMKKKRC